MLGAPDTAVFSMGTPSMTMSGSLLALSEAPPRIRIRPPAPGEPSGVICTPAILPDEEVAGRGDSTLLEVLRIEGADGSGEVLLLHGAVADDDDFLEVLSTLGEDDLQRERSATESYGLRGIADAGDDEVPILGGTDGEVPVDIGDDALRGLLDLDGSPDDASPLSSTT